MQLTNMKKIRQDRGLTQAALAERLGISQARVSAIERGLGVSRVSARRIANELDVSIADLEEATVTFKRSELPEGLLALMTESDTQKR